MKRLKAFYTLAELARALGISRWTVRRWLDANRIPYEMRRRVGGTRGGRIVVMVSELRTYAPSYFSSIREELEVEQSEAVASAARPSRPTAAHCSSRRGLSAPTEPGCRGCTACLGADAGDRLADRGRL